MEVGGTHFMHSRSLMTLDPRIPTIEPGRSTLDFYRPGRHRVHQARSAVRCWASGMKGELHPTKNHEGGRRGRGGGGQVGEAMRYDELVWAIYQQL